MAEEVMSARELQKAFPGSTEIAQQSSIFTSDELQAIETWDDYLQLTEEKGQHVFLADKVLGDGFTILAKDDKDQLCGLPLVFVEWRFNKGQMGEFASAKVLVKTDDSIRKVIINDGSTGICKQLKELTERTGQYGGLVSMAGLKRSDYTYENDKGVQIPATTYYIDTSKVN